MQDTRFLPPPKAQKEKRIATPLRPQARFGAQPPKVRVLARRCGALVRNDRGGLDAKSPCRDGMGFGSGLVEKCHQFCQGFYFGGFCQQIRSGKEFGCFPVLKFHSYHTVVYITISKFIDFLKAIAVA